MKFIIIIILTVMLGITMQAQETINVNVINGNTPAFSYTAPYLNQTFSNAKYTNRVSKSTPKKIAPYITIKWDSQDGKINIKTLGKSEWYKVEEYTTNSNITTIYFDNKKGGYGTAILDGGYCDCGWLSDGLGNRIRLK